MNKQDLQGKGYTVIPEIFSPEEVEAIITAIDEAGDLAAAGAAGPSAAATAAAAPPDPAFRRTSDLFAIRRFLQVVPAVQPLLFTPAFIALISQTFGPGYFPVRSIYFDKPPGSNWFVAWHQDLTISVDRKLPLTGFGPWTVKGDQYAVQPPLHILEGMYTIRIHLDDTDETNGALRVLPGSHLRGIERYSPSTRKSTGTTAADADSSNEVTCRVSRGGIMIMRPLLQHASSRSSAGKQRRVIHIEFSNVELPSGLNWAERFTKEHFFYK